MKHSERDSWSYYNIVYKKKLRGMNVEPYANLKIRSTKPFHTGFFCAQQQIFEFRILNGIKQLSNNVQAFRPGLTNKRKSTSCSFTKVSQKYH